MISQHHRYYFLHYLFIIFIVLSACGRSQESVNLEDVFKSPPESAKPWVFWYWMNAAVSAEGITADLEAMKSSGIAGAYLMPIQGPKDPSYIKKPIVQLTPEWWRMVEHSLKEADRLDLDIAMHASDGFALAGGPWITPQLSMQKVVWDDTVITQEGLVKVHLPQPLSKENYYNDIAVYAYPTLYDEHSSSYTTVPRVSTSMESEAQFLAVEGNKRQLRSKQSCWIQYQFDQPFTCRSIGIYTKGNNYQSHRLIVQKSDDGLHFETVTRLIPPRHGWQDTDENVTHAIPLTKARFFRLVYDKEGTEPGAEDLDAAKWSPTLKICGIELSGRAQINQYEGKNGSVWRISERATADEVPQDQCLNIDDLINITDKVDSTGLLTWHKPNGAYTILRMGHTSTGHTNYTGGGGLGLECDKFNPQAVHLQFKNWFEQAVIMAGPELVERVLKIFHVDSWECGSQNWSPVFRNEFRQRRGYDPLNYLPVMAGIPLQDADVSERFLYDVRQTIAELVLDVFYNELAKSAHQYGCSFSAECVSPTMMSDGMLHYKAVDIPMGEFWLKSPTHDKPNDMLDALSGAHIYGKPIVQAECFTQLRMAWDEYPGMLKTLGDRHYALGVNKFVFHVFTHNPFVDKSPGMSLNGVGLFFQRDQTWWQPAKAWMQYVQRSQALLQQGCHVADVAVFTGEEMPRRAILPERLVPSLPGLYGHAVVEREQQRKANIDQPLHEMPAGVNHSANMALVNDWLDPLRGYAYDSFNPDALLNLAQVEEGCIVLPGGAKYRMLVLPQARPMQPHSEYMSVAVAARLLLLVQQGATIVVHQRPIHTLSLTNYTESEQQLEDIMNVLYSGNRYTLTDKDGHEVQAWTVGKGRVIQGPFMLNDLDALDCEKDVVVSQPTGDRAQGIAWTHRQGDDFDIYFISNQWQKERICQVSFRVEGMKSELFNPVTGEVMPVNSWAVVDGRTTMSLSLNKNESVFIVFRQPSPNQSVSEGLNYKHDTAVTPVGNTWHIAFDTAYRGSAKALVTDTLIDWSKQAADSIKYYSGTAYYTTTFDWGLTDTCKQSFFLYLGKVAYIAEVWVNDKPCGVAWTYPYQVDVSSALRQGKNKLKIAVTNTWTNRLIGDHVSPPADDATWTNVPYRLEGKPLLPSGLLGPVVVKTVSK